MNCNGSSFTDQFERELAQFERAWQRKQTPDIREFLPHDATTAELLEFILVDMEYRWAPTANIPSIDRIGPSPTWNPYLIEFPKLGEIESIPLSSILEFLNIARNAGRKLEPDWIRSLYTSRMDEIMPELARLEREVRVEKPELCFADLQENLSYQDYLLEELIGAGGFGKVYRAVERSTDRSVVVKALRKDRQQDFVSIDRFVSEAKLISQFDHPHIVHSRGLGRFPSGGFFIVMDWIDGESLQQRIDRGPIAPVEAIAIIRQIASAITYAHEQGVYHCDLKPANILLDQQGIAYVTDFGLAQLADETESFSASGGTPAYLAPEQWAHETGKISPATDIFGLGGILVAMLTGRPPRTSLGQSPFTSEMIHQPVSLEFNKEFPPALTILCARSLLVDPEERIQTVRDFIRQLDQFDRQR